jgi:hypothetical protein
VELSLLLVVDLLEISYTDLFTCSLKMFGKYLVMTTHTHTHTVYPNMRIFLPYSSEKWVDCLVIAHKAKEFCKGVFRRINNCEGQLSHMQGRFMFS